MDFKLYEIYEQFILVMEDNRNHKQLVFDAHVNKLEECSVELHYIKKFTSKREEKWMNNMWC